MRITHEDGVTSHTTSDGTTYEADEHGFIDMPDEAAAVLLSQPGWRLATDEDPLAGEPADEEQPEPKAEAPAGPSRRPPAPKVDLDQLERPALDKLAAKHHLEVGERWGDKRVRKALRDAGVTAG